jgi:hypothetical protein
MNEADWQQKWRIKLLDSPQVFCKLPREAYDELPGLNSSLIKEVSSNTLAHAYRKYIDPNRLPQEKKDAFVQGSIAHAIILEWEEFDQRYSLPPDLPSRPTNKQLEEPPELTKTGKPAKAHETWKEYKAIEDQWIKWEKDNPGIEIISQVDYDKGAACAIALLSHPVLKHRYTKTEEHRILNEITFTYIDPVTKRRIKARLDSIRIFSDHIWVGDIKTALDAGEGADHFGKSIASFAYIIQSAFYHDAIWYCRAALEQVLGLTDGCLIILPIVFEWVAIEKQMSMPEFIGRYYMTEEQLSDGRRLYRLAIDKIHRSHAIDYWPGYDTAAKPAVLPGWYKRVIQEQIRRLEEE